MVSQFRPGHRYQCWRKEHCLIVGMGDQKAYPFVLNTGERKAKRRLDCGRGDSPEEEEERRDNGEGEESWTGVDIHGRGICGRWGNAQGAQGAENSRVKVGKRVRVSSTTRDLHYKRVTA